MPARRRAARSDRCVFAGPSLHGVPLPPGVARFGPVALGSVFRAVQAGYRRIGIVDGVFGNQPAVWHKEILYAIASGAAVAGAASMGALRAAELRGLGMAGIGRIYRLYACGAWTDDDEVAVLHAPQDLQYQPLSEAMANLRFTLRRARLAGLVDREVEARIAARLKALHFSERTRPALRQAALRELGRARGTRLAGALDACPVDVKRDDARRLLDWIGAADAPGRTAPPAGRRTRFLATRHWRSQFELQIADVPPLR